MEAAEAEARGVADPPTLVLLLARHWVGEHKRRFVLTASANVRVGRDDNRPRIDSVGLLIGRALPHGVNELLADIGNVQLNCVLRHNLQRRGPRAPLLTSIVGAHEDNIHRIVAEACERELLRVAAKVPVCGGAALV